MGSSSSKDTDCWKCKKNSESDKENYFTFPKCNHVSCKQCLCEYLQNFSNSMIKCPSKGCSHLVPDNIVRQCLSDPQLELYDKFCLPPTAVRCKVPNCPAVVIIKAVEGVYTCPMCNQPYCVACKMLHLENEPCKNSRNNAKYEGKGQKIVAEKIRLELLQSMKNNSLIKNPEKSICTICGNFILPREGIIVSACLHKMCRVCLVRSIQSKAVLAELTCGMCDKHLSHMECKEIIGEVKLNELCLNAIKFQFYHCQTPDCFSFWDSGKYKGSYKCPKCKIDNCMACQDIHVGLTCAQYKDSERYKRRRQEEEFEKLQNKITCFNCKYSFVRSGGCGAMKCSKCLKQVCAFSGKELGPNGCNCRKSNKCHVKCTIGCIPDGKSDYEEGLRQYYRNN